MSALREHPSSEAVALLPPFEGLTLRQIEILGSSAQLDAAYRAIDSEGVVGFDTESKPTFRQGEASTGPHLVQFAVPGRGFVVQIGAEPPLAFLRAVLESRTIVKVGFGLDSDKTLLRAKLAIELGAHVDLARALRSLRYRQALGAKAAVAVVLGRSFQKSKSVSRSNWSVPVLRPNQLLYAANDAYAALAVFQALVRDGVAIDAMQADERTETKTDKRTEQRTEERTGERTGGRTDRRPSERTEEGRPAPFPEGMPATQSRPADAPLLVQQADSAPARVEAPGPVGEGDKAVARLLGGQGVRTKTPKR